MIHSNSHWLLIDQSNTFTKVALLSNPDQESLAEKVRFQKNYAWFERYPTQTFQEKSLLKIIKEKEITKVILASVVPSKKEELIEWSTKQESPPLLCIDATQHLGIPIAYPDKKAIGADRLANAAALYAADIFPTIAVDFGTAITFDILDATGTYQGGIIAPGIQTTAQALHQQTAQLPLVTLKGLESMISSKAVIGKNTREAIQIGLLKSISGLINEVYNAIVEEFDLPYPPYLIATGGDAGLLQQYTQRFDKVIPHLTLYGVEMLGYFLNKKLVIDKELISNKA